ncbi:MAG: sugar ABC transporter ATP-binding protein [Chloroflexi bacterium]|nr:sugar ABC transporter ATP-binding protein [Chloroflexota bacterium]
MIETEQTTPIDQQQPGTAQPDNDIILEARNVTKLYPGTVALDNVTYHARRGKVNVLVGENGAGKSTLMKILAGVIQATEGELVLEGEEIRPKNPREAEARGIGIIHQELNLFQNLSVAENIFMAHEITWGKTIVRHGDEEAEAAKLLNRLEQPIDPRTLVSYLRVGQQQIVEIAKALALDINILIMDEPTSALSTAEVEVLFRVIEELKANGVTIIYISHKLEELMQIGDYIAVLRDGRLVAESPMAEIDLPWIIERMVGRETTSTYRAPQHAIGDEILRVENAYLPRPGTTDYLLEDVSLTLHAGEILGVYGLMGAGRTELFEVLMGLHPRARGNIWLDGQPLNRQINERIKQGIMLIPEDRQREGLVQTMTVADNMLLASLRRYVRRFYLSRHAQQQNITRLVNELAIKVANVDFLISSLSGGNQQKVVVGKALLTEPKVLLMDEPTRGIDVGAKEEIFEIMRQLAAQGLGIMFVSTELKEIMAASDRILVMSKGRITREFVHDLATEEGLVSASAMGHELGQMGR